MGQTFVASSEHLNFRLMTCCFWLSCAIRMWSGCTWIKLSCFSKVFGIIWSYGNTGYKVSNSGIQNTSPHPLLQDEIGFQSLFSVIVFTLLIDFKPLTVHSSAATPIFRLAMLRQTQKSMPRSHYTIHTS